MTVNGVIILARGRENGDHHLVRDRRMTVSEEDKEEEERERAQLQFATNNFEMLLQKQKAALENMQPQEREAKQRRK